MSLNGSGLIAAYLTVFVIEAWPSNCRRHYFHLRRHLVALVLLGAGNPLPSPSFVAGSQTICWLAPGIFKPAPGRR